MSHNDIKIGTSEPNRQGDLSVSIGDISDVSVSSPVDGEVLKFSGTAWSNSSSSVSGQYIWIGQGESNSYSNTGNTGAVSNGDAWYPYDSSPKKLYIGREYYKN